MFGLSAAVIPLAQLLSVFFCRVMVSRNLRALAALEASVIQTWPEWYVARIDFSSISSASEYGLGYVICAIFLLISGLLASLLADFRSFRKPALAALHALVSKNTGIISDWKSYQHLTYVRMRKSFRPLRLISAAAFFLPVFLLGASLLFGSVSGAVDMSVGIVETTHTEVDASLVDSVMGIAGVECMPICGDDDTVIILPLQLDDRTWIQTAGEILSIPGIETYNVSVSRLSFAVTNLKYGQIRWGFGILALTALFAACIGVFYVIGDLFRSREEEFVALTMFGVQSLFRLKAVSAFRMLLPGNIAVSMIGMLLVIDMNLDGGAVSGFWMTRLISMGLCIGFVMPALFACSAAYLLCPERRKS